MVGRPFDGAEAAQRPVEGARRRLALAEEFDADAAAAVFGQQHAFAEIENITQRQPGRQERRPALLELPGQRQRTGGADAPLAIEGDRSEDTSVGPKDPSTSRPPGYT